MLLHWSPCYCCRPRAADPNHLAHKSDDALTLALTFTTITLLPRIFQRKLARKSWQERTQPGQEVKQISAAGELNYST